MRKHLEAWNEDANRSPGPGLRQIRKWIHVAGSIETGHYGVFQSSVSQGGS